MSGEDEVLAALQSASPLFGDQPRRGVVSPSVLTAMRRAVLGQLSGSVSSTVDARSVAFVHEAHLRYPDDALEAQMLGRTSTMIVQHLERTSHLFQQLAVELIATAHDRVSFSAYISDSKSSSLGSHRDEWDNIVVQLSGAKVFHFPGADDIYLNAGDLLTIPENVVHSVSTPKRSIHLSVVMLRRQSMPR